MKTGIDTEFADTRLAGIAAAIAEPARARILCCLMDGRARTSTELSVIAQVSPSTASAHLARLADKQLVQVVAQGKHRYYQLAGVDVAAALEALLRLSGVEAPRFVPNTPDRLRLARTCYDHLAGSIAVALHDELRARGWLAGDSDYLLSDDGAAALQALGLDLAGARRMRRRFACPCLDWSERRVHIGGALGAALLALLLRQGWLERQLDSRALTLTRDGQRQLQHHFGIAPSASI